MTEVSTTTTPTASAESPRRLLAELDAPIYLTCAEAAKRVDSKVWPVAKLAREGKLQAVRYGELLLVSAEAVDSHRDTLYGMVPASSEALTALEVPLQAINEARGTQHTVQSVAYACEIDLEGATREDVGRMARYIGGVLMT
jgi:excisionase family DNA binding protein